MPLFILNYTNVQWGIGEYVCVAFLMACQIESGRQWWTGIVYKTSHTNSWLNGWYFRQMRKRPRVAIGLPWHYRIGNDTVCLPAQVIGPIDHAWRLKDIVPLFQGALDNFSAGTGCIEQLTSCFFSWGADMSGNRLDWQVNLGRVCSQSLVLHFLWRQLGR